jgi:cyclomaltodextrinase / maltogenic alpha-amylase / neopullulanase
MSNLLRIYEIMIDRFSTGDRELDSNLSFKTSKNWLGGTLRGVSNKLDYIKKLGMDAIWLSPVFVTSAYHGYSVTNYFDIDPHFGSRADLKLLIDKAHRLGIKVILDFVANHVSSMHPFFLDTQKNRSSRYFDWFLFNSWPSDYEHFLDSRGLPKLNLENEEAKKYMIDAAQFWIKESSVDGYRLDYAIGPPMSFWNDFAKSCRQLSPNFMLLPEIWLSGLPQKYLETMWFVNHNVDQKKRLSKLLGAKSSLLSAKDSPEELAMQLFSKITDTFLDFPLSFKLRKMVEEKIIKHFPFSKMDETKGRRFVFLDNHDLERLMWICKNDSKLFLESLKVLSSFQDVVVYYGTEIGMSQSNKFESHSDIEARKFMKWDLDEKEERLLHGFKEIFVH